MNIPLPTLPNHPPIPAQGGTHNEGEQKDPENEMWNMYLDEVKEDDKRITDAWKEDANGLLMFTGLFSATVGAFVIEFYKKLSPDSGDQTVDLLQQFSKQFANYPNGNYSTATVTTQPFTPSTSIVWVNAMWLISLVLSLTSALIATMLQQWARRYVETPKIPSEPNHRARVRWFLFLGTDVYKMRLLVEIAPTLLHLSVYMFFAGLVIVFHTINKKVAIAIDVSVGLFGLAYIMLSFLPCIDVRCPYRTPMSYILWYPCHIFLSVIARCLHGLVEKLYGCFVGYNLGDDIRNHWQRRFVDWLDSRENAMKKHWQYVMDGFGNSVVNGAKKAEDGDHEIFSYLFKMLSLIDKSKLRKLAASIPRDRILELIRPVESGKIGLRDPLLVLLRNCEEDTGTTGPDEKARKRSLLLCLDAIYDISKTPDVIPEFNFVRANYAKIGLMRTLWEDSDPTIRVRSRSICALIARRVGRKDWPEAEELRWLHEVIGDQSYDILNATIGTRDRMNFKSFVHGVFSNQVGDLPTNDTISFKETLAILLDVETDSDFGQPVSRNQLSDEVRLLHQDDPEGSREVIYRLLSMFQFIPSPFPTQTIQFPVPAIPGQSASLPPLPTSKHSL